MISSQRNTICFFLINKKRQQLYIVTAQNTNQSDWIPYLVCPCYWSQKWQRWPITSNTITVYQLEVTTIKVVTLEGKHMKRNALCNGQYVLMSAKSAPISYINMAAPSVTCLTQCIAWTVTTTQLNTGCPSLFLNIYFCMAKMYTNHNPSTLNRRQKSAACWKLLPVVYDSTQSESLVLHYG